MGTYIITEKQNPQSTRTGVTIKAKSLADAKRRASRMQFFCSTVMEIADSTGPVAIKAGGKWRQHSDYRPYNDLPSALVGTA